MSTQTSEIFFYFNYLFYFHVQFLSVSRYVELLINNPFLVQYIDVILKDERISLNDPIILNFAEIYYSKV